MIFAGIYSQIAFLKNVDVVGATLWLTGFLCVLNLGLAYIYRKKQVAERVSYFGVLSVELVIFMFALLLSLRVIGHIPFPLPPGLPFDRAEMGAAIAIAIGLFPATYWHRVSLSETRARIVQDAKTLKERNGGIRVKAPGEWIN
jgi:hypothetical protein